MTLAKRLDVSRSWDTCVALALVLDAAGERLDRSERGGAELTAPSLDFEGRRLCCRSHPSSGPSLYGRNLPDTHDKRPLSAHGLCPKRTS